LARNREPAPRRAGSTGGLPSRAALAAQAENVYIRRN